MKFIYSVVFYILIILLCIIIKTNSIIQSRPNPVSGLVSNSNNKFHFHYNNNQTIIQTNNTKQPLIINYFSLQKHCKYTSCEYCCIDTNKCGSKLVCENAKDILLIVNNVFVFVCIVLTVVFIIKCCFLVDSLPEQIQSQKLNSTELKDVLQIYNILTKTRSKFIYQANPK